MPATTNNQFNPYGTSFGAAESIYSDFSPDALFNAYDDFNTDFTSDSNGSPISATSEFSSNPFATSDSWMTWDGCIDQASPVNSFLNTDLFEGSVLRSAPAPTLSTSLAVNPMDLTMPPNNLDLFSEDMAKPLPLFQTPPAAIPPPQPEHETSEPTAQRRSSRALKRKSVSSDDGAQPPQVPHGDDQEPKKTTHNMIEKRYRVNLNEKITQLRDSIPALRVAAQRLNSGEQGDGNVDELPLGSLVGAPKLNKATILSKATEYILFLERKNNGLATENNMLRRRVQGLEMFMMERGAYDD